MADIEYTQLNVGDRYQIAQDRLRSIETEHYRLSLDLDVNADEDTNPTAHRLKEHEAKIAALRPIVDSLYAEARGRGDQRA